MKKAVKKFTSKELQELLNAMDEHYQEGLQLKKKLLQAIDSSEIQKIRKQIKK